MLLRSYSPRQALGDQWSIEVLARIPLHISAPLWSASWPSGGKTRRYKLDFPGFPQFPFLYLRILPPGSLWLKTAGLNFGGSEHCNICCAGKVDCIAAFRPVLIKPDTDKTMERYLCYA